MPSNSSPRVLKSDRVGPILEGVVESTSEPGKRHYGRVLVSSNALCGCEASRLGGQQDCKHMKALLESLDKDELVQLILDGLTIPE